LSMESRNHSSSAIKHSKWMKITFRQTADHSQSLWRAVSF